MADPNKQEGAKPKKITIKKPATGAGKKDISDYYSAPKDKSKGAAGKPGAGSAPSTPPRDTAPQGEKPKDSRPQGSSPRPAGSTSGPGTGPGQQGGPGQGSGQAGYQNRGPSQGSGQGGYQNRGPGQGSGQGGYQNRGPSQGSGQGGYQNRGPGQGSGQGGYQNRGPGQGSGQGGYQNRGPGQGGQGGYQNRGPGQGSGPGGYQNRGPGQGGQGGYQNRGPGQGSGPGGYQNRGPGQGGPGGYQNRGPGQGGPGGYQNRGPGQGGQRPPGQGGQRPGFQRPSGPGQKDKRTPFDSLVEASKSSLPTGGPGGTPTRKSPPNKSPGTRTKEEIRRDEEDNFFRKLQHRKHQQISGTTVPKQIEIMESIQVGELAKKLNLKPGDVISRLMKMGELVTINQIIDTTTATLLANEYGCEVKVVSLFDETVIEAEQDTPEDSINRPPVVTIMGHVDHGKTKLLDAIRKTNVVDKEAGAITQHIGAYQVATAQGKITFLDTPGHEAFTAMRARGAKVTDIVILVVAADDGVKEQTLEALTHAKEAGVPIIVAINKIDLHDANPDRIKQELSNHGLQPEEWGGSTMYVHISAKANLNIEKLLEMVLLQAEVMDLKANPNLRAVGRVVEARVDPGKGPVATVLIQKGTLREGDPYVVGVFSGRVRAMFDDFGVRMKEAPPSTPVEITGIDGVPEAGDPFQAVENEKYGREIAGKRQHYKQITDAANRAHPTLGDLKSWIQNHKELKVIIKADVQGSVEAIRDGLTKLTTEDVKLRVIFGATGAISESDVQLAAASNAIVIGFQVRATPKAQDLAEHTRVEIRYYSIIYNVIEEIKASMEGLLEPDKVEEITGRAEVRQIFRISKVGNVCGCMVLNGKIRRTNRVRVIRDGVVVYTGNIKAIRRVKDEVAEIAEGFECGISVDGFNDITEKDILEAFEVKEIARKL